MAEVRPTTLIAIVVVYLLTRLAMLWRFPPFLDEATYASWTLSGYEDIHFRFISLANGKEPLLTWIGMGWMTLGAEPLTAVRLVSLAAGLVTLTMVGLIGRRLGGDRVGLAAAGLYAVAPFFVVHDAIGIMEPLVTAAAMTALYLQIRLAERPGLELALPLGIALAAGVLTKETGKFALVLLPLSLLCFRWRGRDVVWRLGRWVASAGIAAAVAGVGYSILLLSDYYDDLGPARRAIGMHRAADEALAHPWRYADQNWPLFREALGGYLTAPVLLLVAVGAGLALRASPRLALLLSAWALLPLGAAALLANVANPRYILTAVPPLVVLAAYGLVKVAEYGAPRLPARWRTARLVAVAAVLLAPALVFDARVLADPAGFRYPALDDAQFATGWAAGRAWVEVADELERRAGGRQTRVQLGELASPVLRLELRDRPNIEVVSGSDPRTRAAAYAVENGAPYPPETGIMELRPVWEVRRPRGGTPLRLLARGVVWEGRFYTTPDALRAGLGLPDSEFDAFIASHPEVGAWYAAWYARA
jgi:4-amino-4-deoxy-L-arabinose transferase-like glycosyltransferase